MIVEDLIIEVAVEGSIIGVKVASAGGGRIAGWQGGALGRLSWRYREVGGVGGFERGWRCIGG